MSPWGSESWIDMEKVTGVLSLPDKERLDVIGSCFPQMKLSFHVLASAAVVTWEFGVHGWALQSDENFHTV